MEGYVIITGKEELARIIREVFTEMNAPKPESAIEPRYLDMDKLLNFLRQNGCHISKSQIYKLTRSEKIPHRKIGKSLLFDRDEILNWLHDGK